uniref:Uncharacterized protein n=1 Tax=Ananas comosus var. bracteatus TaxID=296719 RepID=A0A6V7NYH8_ANACO|nr:unnamed protein product [Ananas comosus var. bracteatus]
MVANTASIRKEEEMEMAENTDRLRAAAHTISILIREFPASTVGVSARTRRRSVGFRRGLIRWIQDFERNPRSPYLPDFVEVRLVESVLFPASTVGVSARTRRRSVGFRRGLIRWIQDFERNPRSPYLPDFVEVRLVESVLYLTVANFGTETWAPSGLTVGPVRRFGVGLCRGHLESLFELDRDTLHTRLGSSHECHSGGGRGAFALVSLMPVGLALHGPAMGDRCRFGRYPLRTTCFYSSSHAQLLPMFCRATGFGYCAFRRSGSRQGRREVEPYPTDRARGTPLLQVLLTLRIQGKFLVYGGFVGVPGERDIRGVT